MRDSIILVPNHCLLFYFALLARLEHRQNNVLFKIHFILKDLRVILSAKSEKS